VSKRRSRAGVSIPTSLHNCGPDLSAIVHTFDHMNSDMILRLALERQAGLRDQARRIRLARTSRERQDTGPRAAGPRQEVRYLRRVD
jgi:hypothetical protein